MPIRIGANPIGWSNDDLQEIGGATSLETCLDEAREAGFVGMELGHKFPREPKALKAALAPFGMACISGWYSAELLKRDAEEEMRHLRPHLDLLKAMGSNVLVFAETSNAIHGDRSKPLSQRPVMEAGDWAQFGARITEVAERPLRLGATALGRGLDVPALVGAALTTADRDAVACEVGLGGVDVPCVEVTGLGVTDPDDPRQRRPVRQGRIGVDVVLRLDLDRRRARRGRDQSSRPSTFGLMSSVSST